jgi:phenylacetate-CoA ligase
MRVADDFVALHINANDEIIITALHSYGFPLINYKLGDCGKTEEVEEMAATEPFSALRLTIGRSTDNFITHEGRKVASSALGVYISTFQLSVNEQQIIQNSCTEFVINIVPGSAFSKTMYEEVIYKVFREYFGYEVRIQFNIMTRIPVSASGKKLMAKRMFDIE